jgi:hypothetical protein
MTGRCAGKLYVNLERRLLEAIREARWLVRMGMEVPEAVRLLLPQEPKFRSYHERLTHLLLVRCGSWPLKPLTDQRVIVAS